MNDFRWTVIDPRRRVQILNVRLRKALQPRPRTDTIYGNFASLSKEEKQVAIATSRAIVERARKDEADEDAATGGSGTAGGVNGKGGSASGSAGKHSGPESPKKRRERHGLAFLRSAGSVFFSSAAGLLIRKYLGPIAAMSFAAQQTHSWLSHLGIFGWTPQRAQEFVDTVDWMAEKRDDPSRAWDEWLGDVVFLILLIISLSVTVVFLRKIWRRLPNWKDVWSPAATPGPTLGGTPGATAAPSGATSPGGGIGNSMSDSDEDPMVGSTLRMLSEQQAETAHLLAPFRLQ